MGFSGERASATFKCHQPCHSPSFGTAEAVAYLPRQVDLRRRGALIQGGKLALVLKMGAHARRLGRIQSDTLEQPREMCVQLRPPLRRLVDRLELRRVIARKQYVNGIAQAVLINAGDRRGTGGRHREQPTEIRWHKETDPPKSARQAPIDRPDEPASKEQATAVIVGAQIFDERFVGLIVGAAAQLAILVQPSVDVHEKGYRQRWLFEHPPSPHHDRRPLASSRGTRP